MLNEPTSVESDGSDGASSHQASLRRVLGPFALTMIGVSSTVGVGIFVTSGVTAAQNTGPAMTLSILLAAIGVLVVAMCYCELAAMMPVAGSSYSYIAASLGRFPAWMVAWAMVLEYLISVSAVGSGWSGYLNGLLIKFGILIPDVWTRAPFTFSDNLEFSMTGGYGNFPAAIFTLMMTGILAIGIRESARVNNIIVLLKIAIILAVVGVGALYVNPANWHPFIPPNTGEWGHYGMSGVMRGTAIAVWMYIGFETISTCAQESKNPKRDLATGMLLTMAICTALYLAISIVMTGLLPSAELDVPDPIVVVLNSLGEKWSWLATLVTVGALVGIGATLISTLYGQIRVFFIMARDGQMPKSFAIVHPKYRTPIVATWFTGAICAVITLSLPIDVLVELVSMGTLLAFAAVCASVLVFRHKHPDWERPFRIIGSPFVPALGILICLGLMGTMPLRSWVQLVGWMALGAVLYRRKRVVTEG